MLRASCIIFLFLLCFSSFKSFAGSDQRRINLNIYPLLGYQTLDVRISDKFTIGGIYGSFNIGTGFTGFATTENIAVKVVGGMISYWPDGALKDGAKLKNGSDLSVFAGTLNSTDTYCTPTCAISTTQGPYGAVFWQRYWMWGTGFNLSVGVGAEYIGVDTSTGTKPAYTAPTTKFTLPLGIGWAF